MILTNEDARSLIAQQGEDVIIPSKYTDIHILSFDCTEIKSIFIPKTIKHIGNFTFDKCRNLIKVIFEEGSQCNSLGFYVFSECINLIEIELPDSILEMHTGTFMGCENLKTVKLPKNLVKIPANTFLDCGKLENVVLPENLKEIEFGAFCNCSKLPTLNLPHLTRIDVNVFSGSGSKYITKDQIVLPKSYSVPENWNTERALNFINIIIQYAILQHKVSIRSLTEETNFKIIKKHQDLILKVLNINTK